MSDVWNRAEPESPCVKICLIHPEAKICTGCYRTIGEIAAWARMSPQERREIMETLPERKPMLAKRRGGRAARLDRRSSGETE